MAQIDGEPIRAKAQIGQANQRQLYKLIQNANIEHETTKTGRPNKHFFKISFYFSHLFFCD